VLGAKGKEFRIRLHYLTSLVDENDFIWYKVESHGCPNRVLLTHGYEALLLCLSAWFQLFDSVPSGGYVRFEVLNEALT
jgi:hypothetical protein